MSLTFYYSPMSTAGITELVLEELGTPCERVKIDMQRKETQQPEYLRLNPNGKVPLIVHDGVPIWESAAITLYLGEVFGVEKGLYPAPSPKRGEAMKWIVWTNVTLLDPVFRWMRNTSEWTPEEQHNAKAAEAAQTDIHQCLGILDRALGQRQFLVDGYTLADTHLHAVTGWFSHMNVDHSSYRNLKAWSERCAARPAYARVMARG